MSKAKLVTVNQAIALKELGFHEEVVWHIKSPNIKKKSKMILCGYIIEDWNRYCANDKTPYISVPTVDEAIDWLRRKFNVVIYDAVEPYTDPLNNKTIRYSYRVKFCNTTWGWNMRERIGQSKWSPNSYAMKRQAITLAIRWINKHTEPKRKKAKVVKM